MANKKLWDKRRIPYNIWINVLGCVIFLLIASLGVFVISIGYNADQIVVVNETSESCRRSNWQDNISRTIMWLVGIATIIAGIIAWNQYAEKHYWHDYETCK